MFVSAVICFLLLHYLWMTMIHVQVVFVAVVKCFLLLYLLKVMLMFHVQVVCVSVAMYFLQFHLCVMCRWNFSLMVLCKQNRGVILDTAGYNGLTVHKGAYYMAFVKTKKNAINRRKSKMRRKMFHYLK